MSEIHTHVFENGLTLLAEPIVGVQSVGLTMLLPAGVACEPADKLGSAALLSEMIFRGAGDLNARQHSDALDQLGVKRHSGVQVRYLSVGATLLGERLGESLPLITDMIRKPTIGDDAFAPARELAVQAIDGLEDEPQEKVSIELAKRYLPAPLGRSSLGERDHITAMSADDIRRYATDQFVPGGAVIGIAGAIEFDDVRRRFEQLLGDWSGDADEPTITDEPTRGYAHINATSAQQHIGVAYDTVPESHEDSMLQRVAVAALSGGMSGRLFTEVREKRGLCYAVYARYASFKERGAVRAYAGTTTERAQETLDVMTGELHRLSEGIDEDEFQRAVVGLKSRLVMQGESTSARGGAIASDYALLGRARTLDEIAEQIDAVTLDKVNAFLAANRPADLTTVNVGPKPLNING